MVETRKVSFKELGLVVGPGREVWGPRRITNEAYTRKCEEILEGEAKRKPLYRVSMSIDHASKNVVFTYLPIDFAYESKVREVNRIMEKAKLDKIKKDFGLKGGKR